MSVYLSSSSETLDPARDQAMLHKLPSGEFMKSTASPGTTMQTFEMSHNVETDSLGRKISLKLYLETSIVVYVFFVLAKCFYNLFLHPLRRFPGPRFAAMTSLYEFWFDVIQDGQYLWEIEKMHRQYGKVDLSALYFDG